MQREVDNDFELQATLRQNAHNNRLKKGVLDNEESIRQLHSGEYTNNAQYQLSRAFAKSTELVLSLEAGLKWNLTTLYDLPKLMRQCGLELSLQELYRPEQSANYFDLIPLKKEFSAVRALTGKAAEHRPLLERAGLLSAVQHASSTLDYVEAKIKASQLDATPIAAIASPIVARVKECLAFLQIDDALQDTEDQIAVHEEGLSRAKQVHHTALGDGDTRVAEEAVYTMIETLEKLMELIGDQFAVINGREEEGSTFNDIFEVLKDSNKRTLGMKLDKRRLKKRCETDLHSIHKRISVADEADVVALAKYAEYKTRSDAQIKQNAEEHDRLFKEMVRKKYTLELEGIVARLREIGRERYDLMTERMEKVDEEERRKVEYQQFLEVVAHHKKTLELTIDNCDLAVEIIGKMEQLMFKVCSAIRNWYDMLRESLHNLRLSVHKQHLAYFRETYLSIGNLIYKKHKRLEDLDGQLRREHIQLEFCIETFDIKAKQHSEAKKELLRLRADGQEELQMLQAKAQQAVSEFEESEVALRGEGYDFLHPVQELEDAIAAQREKIVAYKAQVNKEEDVRIAAEREEIRRIIALNARKAVPEIEDEVEAYE